MRAQDAPAESAGPRRGPAPVAAHIRILALMLLLLLARGGARGAAPARGGGRAPAAGALRLEAINAPRSSFCSGLVAAGDAAAARGAAADRQNENPEAMRVPEHFRVFERPAYPLFRSE